MKKVWEVQPRNFIGGGGNSLLRKEGDDSFCISWQPNRHVGFMGTWDADDDSGETAICDYRDEPSTRFYILRGDHREPYERLIDEGVHACIAYFETKPELRSTWSSDAPAEEFLLKRIDDLKEKQNAS
jgi:hypothetical protein